VHVVVALVVQTALGQTLAHPIWIVVKTQELQADTFQTLHTLAHFLRQVLTHIQVMHVTVGNDIINQLRQAD
jgi:hypothetical protein